MSEPWTKEEIKAFSKQFYTLLNETDASEEGDVYVQALDLARHNVSEVCHAAITALQRAADAERERDEARAMLAQSADDRHRIANLHLAALEGRDQLEFDLRQAVEAAIALAKFLPVAGESVYVGTELDTLRNNVLHIAPETTP